MLRPIFYYNVCILSAKQWRQVKTTLWIRVFLPSKLIIRTLSIRLGCYTSTLENYYCIVLQLEIFIYAGVVLSLSFKCGSPFHDRSFDSISALWSIHFHFFQTVQMSLVHLLHFSSFSLISRLFYPSA